MPQDESSCYFGLELVEGGDLRFHLRTNGLFREDQVGFFASCLLSALEHLHDRRVIHRDVKPEYEELVHNQTNTI